MSSAVYTGPQREPKPEAAYVVSLDQLRMTDVESVGGKNASLGEMISQLAESGVRVPGGFATTAQAFRDFLENSVDGGPTLAQRIADRLSALDIDDVRALAQAGAEIRQWIVDTPFQPRLAQEIRESYQRLVDDSSGEMSFAVRSSATAEDLPDASFAGQQETFLNVVGIDNVLDAMKHVFASLYNDRAISYRVHKGFTHAEVALSAGVQRMVRSDVGAAGVMFTLDTESGFQGRGVHHVQLRPGRNRGAGRGQSGRVLRAQADAGAGQVADHPPQDRLQADQDGIHQRGQGRAFGQDRRRADRAAQPLFADRRRRRRTGQIRGHHREALWPSDGYRVGQGRPRRQAVHPAGASRNREIAAKAQRRPAALQAEGQRHGAGLGPRDRPEDRRRPGARDPRSVARWSGCSRATCWSPT